MPGFDLQCGGWGLGFDVSGGGGRGDRSLISSEREVGRRLVFPGSGGNVAALANYEFDAPDDSRIHPEREVRRFWCGGLGFGVEWPGVLCFMFPGGPGAVETSPTRRGKWAWAGAACLRLRRFGLV